MKAPNSAELKEPGELVRIRPGIFDFEPDLGVKLGQAKPEISGAVPTNRHTTIPNDYGPTAVCFDDDPKLLHVGNTDASAHPVLLYELQTPDASRYCC